jgi:hypothetical protein
MVMIRPKRNAMTPDKKPNTAENFSTEFSRRVKNATPVVTRAPVAPAMEIVLLMDYKCEPLAGR